MATIEARSVALRWRSISVYELIFSFFPYVVDGFEYGKTLMCGVVGANSVEVASDGQSEDTHGDREYAQECCLHWGPNR